MLRTESSLPQMVALSQPVSKAAYDYWNALRNARPLPRRRDVDPARMRGFLPHIMLLERVAPAETIFRLAGTGICQAFGRELRDHSLQSLWEPTQRGLIATALAESLDNATPLLLRFRGHTLGRPPLAGEWMLLPLLDDTGAATRVLGSLSVSRDPLGPKAFTRVELLRAETIIPHRDRVELALAAPTPHRAALTLVPAPRIGGKTASAPSMTRPWAGLLRELLSSDDAG